MVHRGRKDGENREWSDWKGFIYVGKKNKSDAKGDERGVNDDPQRKSKQPA